MRRMSGRKRDGGGSRAPLDSLPAMKRILDLIDSPGRPEDFLVLGRYVPAGRFISLRFSTSFRNGGHLSSNLGVVELIRWPSTECSTPPGISSSGTSATRPTPIKSPGGGTGSAPLRPRRRASRISSREESPHDPYNTGHASTALLGRPGAGGLPGTWPERTAAWSLPSSGTARSPAGCPGKLLNQIGNLRIPMIIILNDNEMSIS